MDTMQAFAIGQANRGKDLMVFDWDKAVKIIKERGLKNCGAGLESDFEWTAGMILVDGKPVTDDYTYLASTWTTPQLIVYPDEYTDQDGLYDYEETIGCWIKGSETSYDSGTVFPPHLIKEFNK